MVLMANLAQILLLLPLILVTTAELVSLFTFSYP
jgi:hypothetical protein